MLKQSVLLKLPLAERDRYREAQIAVIEARTALIRAETDILQNHPELFIEQQYSKAERRRIELNTTNLLKETILNALKPEGALCQK